MSAEHDAPATPTFSALGLSAPVLEALAAVGYESPSPIQAATIPPLLAGRDVLGQAQTGTGKTAAFALPALSQLALDQRAPQVLVLAPTRELAIQVAEAFQRYAAKLPGFHVLPIYGGQAYGPQLGGLKRGAHVVVGTPGRLIDHLERGSLDLSQLRWLVLDEADEMLRMGFIDDVEKILKATPPERQTALFSATLPPPIKRIAQQYLRDPAEVTIAAKTRTATTVRQRYWLVSGLHKLDALTRILEAETFEAMIVFARTKQATEELAERLEARGFSAAAINGDIQQQQRERTIARLKDGQLDILVATDVAARGLDVERISHVVNYDIPYDTESYVHRIGRTGRAGRSGEAILFVTPRERQMLRVIERATRQPIEPMDLPAVSVVNDRRIERFMGRITEARESGELDEFARLVDAYEAQFDVPAREIAAALAKLAHGKKPLLLEPPSREERPQRSERPERVPRADRFERTERPPRGRDDPAERGRSLRGERSEFAGPPERFARDAAARAPRPRRDGPEPGMHTYRVAVGHLHGVKPGNLVGAIANEAELDAKNIGRIDIREAYSLIDLPEGMPAATLAHLRTVRVAGQRLMISLAGERDAQPDERPRRPHRTDEGFAPPKRKFDKPKFSGPKRRT
jgi:ATP-dependent RNA helicase DeaD